MRQWLFSGVKFAPNWWGEWERTIRWVQFMQHAMQDGRSNDLISSNPPPTSMPFVRKAGPVIPARSAFTLVEMLVVLTIIMMLISLLLPALAGARAAARTASCASNLRSLGQVTIEYADEYQGMLPYGTYSNPKFVTSVYNSYFGEWANLEFYMLVGPPVTIGNNGIIGKNIPQDLAGEWSDFFWCPDRQEPMTANWGVNYAGNPNVFLTPYTNQVTGMAANESQRLATIPNPSELIAIGDTNQSWPGGGNAAQFLFSWLPSQLTWQYGSYTSTTVIPANPGNTDATTSIINHQGLRYRHDMNGYGQGYTNAVFCDGHVKTMPENGVHVFNVLPLN